ncbi:MAG: hypothetical protein ACTS82_05790 [Arsenophonus sp. ET-DL12-MAG3]
MCYYAECTIVFTSVGTMFFGDRNDDTLIQLNKVNCVIMPVMTIPYYVSYRMHV